MKNLIIIILCIICFYGCSIKVAILSNSLNQYKNFDNNIKKGLWLEIHDTNTVEFVKYKNGVKNGKAIKIYKSGGWAKYQYKSGKLNGLYKSFNCNGKLSTKIKFENGEAKGGKLNSCPPF